MPIRPDLRPLYKTPEAIASRRRALERAGGKFDAVGRYLGGAKCEQCRAPDRTIIWRGPEGLWRTIAIGAPWHRSNGNQTTFEPLTSLRRTVKIVVTVAHLDHNPRHNRVEYGRKPGDYMDQVTVAGWAKRSAANLHRCKCRPTTEDGARRTSNVRAPQEREPWTSREHLTLPPR